MEEVTGEILEDDDTSGEIIRYDAEYHTWVRVLDDMATIGVTDYAQGELNEVTYVELPDTDVELEKGDFLGTIEALKTNIDLLAPVSGTIVEVNEALMDRPELVNASPYEDGWFVRMHMSDPSQVKELITGAEYRQHLMA